MRKRPGQQLDALASARGKQREVVWDRRWNTQRMNRWGAWLETIVQIGRLLDHV